MTPNRILDTSPEISDLASRHEHHASITSWRNDILAEARGWLLIMLRRQLMLLDWGVASTPPQEFAGCLPGLRVNT
jgi:hypothetical protein